MEQDEHGRIRGHYCGNRWCLVRNRVGIGRAVNRYLPVIAGWSSPRLVTLTLPNVKAEELAGIIQTMVSDLVAIARAIRRTDRLARRALRKLECTYNPERDDYHPHFHIAVEGGECAEALRRRWLDLHPEASPAAQDVRPCDGTSLKELFKYFTKLIAKGGNGPTSRHVALPAALDVVFSAMKGRRVYQPMGFSVVAPSVTEETAPIGIDDNTISPCHPGEFVLWEWMQELHDWIDLSSGDVLTGYEPSANFREVVNGIGAADARGYLACQDTYYVGTLKGVGRVYAQTFIDANAAVGFAKLYLSKVPMTAVDLLHDRELPFYEDQAVPVQRVLTDNGREYCGRPLQHPFELYCAVQQVEHRTTRVGSPELNGMVERFNRTFKEEFFRMAYRNRLYESVEALQTDLDAS